MEQHILTDISDYVLDLLPESDRQRVETHAVQCAGCRAALEREQVADLQIRQTLQVVTQPNAARLKALRSDVIPRRETHSVWIGRQLAPVMLLLAILAGTLALQTTRVTGELQLTAPAFYRINTPTATSTSTPTATIANLTVGILPADPGAPAAMPTAAITNALAEPQPAARPAEALPVSTPVAAAVGPISN